MFNSFRLLRREHGATRIALGPLWLIWCAGNRPSSPGHPPIWGHPNTWMVVWRRKVPGWNPRPKFVGSDLQRDCRAVWLVRKSNAEHDDAQRWGMPVQQESNEEENPHDVAARLQPLAKIIRDLAYRLPESGKSLAHIVLTREQATELLRQAAVEAFELMRPAIEMTIRDPREELRGKQSGEHETGYARVERDNYPTPSWVVVDALAEHVPLRGRSVWEMACGDGRMSEALMAAGCARVYSTDIVRNGYAGQNGVLDFLAGRTPSDLPRCDGGITNPPYGKRGKLAVAFITRCLELIAAGYSISSRCCCPTISIRPRRARICSATARTSPARSRCCDA
jgi:hypothetical protein